MRQFRELLVAAVVAFFAVSAGADCSWNIAPPTLDFGNYSVFTVGDGPGQTGYTIQCDKKYSDAAVKLSTGGSGTFLPRLLTNGTYTMQYNLYRGAPPAAVWGDGSGGTSFAAYTNPPGAIDLFSATIYASVLAAQDIAPGTYTDTITASALWANKPIAPGAPSGLTRNTTFTVRVVVTSDCTVSSFTLDFLNYDPIVANSTTPKDSAATLNVFCTRTVPVTVELTTGAHSSGSPRKMINAGGAFLNYDLYTDATRLNVWNTTSTNSGTSTSRLAAIGPLNNGFPVYGRIPAGQDAEIGSYTDTVQARVNY